MTYIFSALILTVTSKQNEALSRVSASVRRICAFAQQIPKREEDFTMLKGGKGYTIADIEALPEGERAELIDGELFRMEAPLRRHQDILTHLFLKIGTYIERNKGKCKIYPAPFAVHIKKDYVEPDISVICDRDKLDEKGCQGAPDWMIEIVSPSSKNRDYEDKVRLYREAGAREYWIVDAETETDTVYDFEHGTKRDGTETASLPEPMRYSFTERIKTGIFEDLWLCLAEMDLS